MEVERDHVVGPPPPVTVVPNAPAWAPSIANVRGNIVPLVDLRKKLAMTPRPATADPRIVVAEVTIAGETTLVGLEADAVYEVFDSTRLAIDDLPRLGTKWRPEFIRGVVKQDQGFVIILDIERILTGETRHADRVAA
jgi:purine-binding chemotaxis protein CheW